MKPCSLEGVTRRGVLYRGACRLRCDKFLYSLAVDRGDGWRLISYSFSWKLATAELEDFADGVS